MISAVLFDKDGTLFDFNKTWSAWAVSFLLKIADGDQILAKKLGAIIGFNFENRHFSEDSVVIAGTPKDITDALRPFFSATKLKRIYNLINQSANNTAQVEAVPLVPLLDSLKERGLVLGVATNDSEQSAYSHLSLAGILNRFSFIAGYDSGFGFKPHPEQLLAFCNEVNIFPNAAIMVGDSTFDLIAGRNAGMKTVGVLTGMADTDTLKPYADVILPDIGGIPDWIDLCNAGVQA
ncbi:MAG: HAD family hydrolase [Aestuariivita sp.]|nr:HAD family hydrolase [Aestuariivita sp.]